MTALVCNGAALLRGPVPHVSGRYPSVCLRTKGTPDDEARQNSARVRTRIRVRTARVSLCPPARIHPVRHAVTGYHTQ